MPRKDSPTPTPELEFTDAPPPSRPILPSRSSDTGEISEKLDQMIGYLHRMDRRDKLRTWGAFVRSMIGFIPIALFLWSAWYFYQHGGEIIRTVAEESAKQAAKYTQDQSGELMKNLQKYLPKK